MKSLISINRQLLAVLPPSARRFLLRYAILSSLLSLIDVVALGLLAIVMSSIITGSPVNLGPFGRIDEVSHYITVLAVFCTLVIIKSGLNILLLRYATSRFASHEVAIGDRLLAAYMRAPWVDRLKRNSAELVRSVDSGVSLTVSGVLMPSMGLAGEIVSVIAVVSVLFVSNWITAVTAIIYLGLIALLLSRGISKRAVANGRRNRQFSFRTVRLLTEAVGALKEVTLRGASPDVEKAVHNNRIHSSKARALAIFLGQVPRFVLEAGLIGGFMLVGGVGLLTSPSGVDPVTNALAAVALFGVAGFRIIPSLTRFQAILSMVHSNSPFAEQVLADIKESEASAKDQEEPDQSELPQGVPDVVLKDVSFTYPGAETPALSGVTMTIPSGSRVAVVGSSGAGKSTLIDLLLGLLLPSSGQVLVGGVPMRAVLHSWRSRVGYVPQEVSLFDASIAQNVALTWDPEQVDEDRVRRALERAQMLETVEKRPDGILGAVGERGMALSGGQRQRLGIARGLYADPAVLVMDEATSALDTATEAAVTQAVRNLTGSVTTITVAHRLSTIRDSDVVFFFADGKLAAQGTFAEVIAQMPDFAEQAALAGLT
ncbi:MULTISPECIES: ABC transporter ATP-binding protein [unclassified Arthrobacter]|uniref:ABC transporter ATP-binding protein n=1 Tax=unclassified Arthrobacter TaxID=235627 RepID=UPI001490D862|nr:MULTISPECIES: ABC transporter ATP-binding protein [unclassified Arthrobacter]NOJ62493.1 ABC transporter ATP-binding protein [Arthrobacter sp. 147(2020)]